MSPGPPSEADAPFDAGLQIERTLLAWRRTTLSVAVVSAAGVRLTAPTSGVAAIGAGTVGVLLTLAAYLLTGVRYRQIHSSLHRSSKYRTNGWVPTALVLATLLLGVLALAYLANADVLTVGELLP